MIVTPGWDGGVGWYLDWGDYGPYYGAYSPDDDYYDDDVAACTLRRVHVHTIHGWLWRTYEYC